MQGPDTKITLLKRSPVFKTHTGKDTASSHFVGNLTVACIDTILVEPLFKSYEKASKVRRARWLRTRKVPLEYEELIRLKQPGRRHFPINFDTMSMKQSEKKYLDQWKNQVICMDCVEGMKYLPENSVDMFVFSPPYDMLRKYHGEPEFDLHQTGLQVYRLLKEGGICAMVIQDQTKNFAKTLTSFRTIVDWVDNIGLKLFECTIYRKNGTEGAWWKKRFRVDHEYMPIFFKGDRPVYFNKEHLKVPSKHGGKMMSGFASRKSDGTTQDTKTKRINPTKCRGTVWDYMCAGDKNKTKRKHPAPYPDQIPLDLIECFCSEGGLVVDPYMGSGSTAIAAVNLDRDFIGFDISKEYIDEIANVRIREARKAKYSKKGISDELQSDKKSGN